MNDNKKFHIRECTVYDARELADFYNRLKYGPVNHGYLLNEKNMKQMIEEVDIILYLCVVHEQQIIGTMLFSKMSGQRAATEKSVWGSKFVIADGFRNGPLPALFFSTSIEMLVEKGFETIEVEVDPNNVNALPLYKRVGFIRSRSNQVDYDGYLCLKSYLPYIISYLKDGYKVEKLDQNIMEKGWKGLELSKNLRSSKIDTIQLNGMEAAEYRMKFGEEIISCWVDVLSNKVAKFEDTRFMFQQYIKEGQHVIVGQLVTLVYEFENKLTQTILVHLKTEFQERNKLLFQKRRWLVKQGEKIYIEIPVVVGNSSKKGLQTNIKFGPCSFDFEYGIYLKDRLELKIHDDVLVDTESYNSILIVKNNQQDTTSVKIDLVNKTGKESKKVVIAPNATENLTLPLPKYKKGNYKVKVTAKNNQQLLLKETHHIHVIDPFEIICKDNADFIILENIDLQLKIDKHSGTLKCFHKLLNRDVLIEAWPDINTPYKNGLREHKKKDIDVFVNKRNEIYLAEKKQDKIILIRKITLKSEEVIKVEDYLLESGTIKLNPWCLMQGSTMYIPLKEGILKEKQIEESFPFLIHDYEFKKDMDLPTNPSSYSMPWSVFEMKEISLGFMWEGHVKNINYGLSWMPALSFEQKKEFSQFKKKLSILPLFFKKMWIKKIDRILRPTSTHYFQLSTKRIDHILQKYRALYNSNDITFPLVESVDMQMHTTIVQRGKNVNLKLSLKNFLLSQKLGTLTLSIPCIDYQEVRQIDLAGGQTLLLTFPLSVNGEKSIIGGEMVFEPNTSQFVRKKRFSLVVYNEENLMKHSIQQKRDIQIYKFCNEEIQIEIVPGFQASITSLRLKESKLLKSNFPSLKSWGQHYLVPLGIFPHLIEGPMTLNRGLIFDDGSHRKFEHRPLKIQDHRGVLWEGVECESADFQVQYLICSGSPLLKVKGELASNYTNNEQLAFHSVWNVSSGKSYIHYTEDFQQKSYKITGKKGKTYLNTSNIILEIKQGFFVTIWSENEDCEIALYEWGERQIEIILLLSRHVLKDGFMVAFSDCLEDSKKYLISQEI
ncbi:hypothetical protein AB0R87_12190 [Bacillus pumilus]|uniref:hypothetical protein n=1 Tax=Bacillus pumilus TaxID=1408 RepID=UPI003454AA36